MFTRGPSIPAWSIRQSKERAARFSCTTRLNTANRSNDLLAFRARRKGCCGDSLISEYVAVKKLFSWMIFAVAAICGASYLLHRFPVTTQASSSEQVEPQAADPKPPDAADAAKAVTMAGPLADYMQGQKSSSSENGKPVVPWTPHAGDIVRDSPTGTGGVILHKTFAVANTVKFFFEIPAHATNPQLRGNYQSFLKQAGDAPADGDPNVEFLLM